MYHVSVTTDLSAAEALWRTLSTQQTLYDVWEFRNIFHAACNATPHFITVEDAAQGLVGLLPLQYDMVKARYEYFGGPFLERNRTFLASGADDRVVALLYDAVPSPHMLTELVAPECGGARLVPGEPAYILPLAQEGVATTNDLLRRLDRSARRNCMKAAARYVLVSCDDPQSAVSTLCTLSTAHFGGDSWLADPAMVKAFQELVSGSVLPAEVEVVARTYVSQGEPLVAFVAVVYRSVFYYLLAASAEGSEHSGLGTYANLLACSEAIERSCTYADLGIGDCGWKSRWGCTVVPQYECATNAA